MEESAAAFGAKRAVVHAESSSRPAATGRPGFARMARASRRQPRRMGRGRRCDGRLLWVETRPEEGGRAVLVKEGAGPDGRGSDVTPLEFAVRSLAQEYGGGAFAVQGGVVVFSNHSDQRLYKQTIGGAEEVYV